MAFATRRVSNLINYLPSVPRIPEKVRNGRFKSFIDFFVNYYEDYASVAKDCIRGARNRPLRATAIGSGLLTLFIAFKTNPDETQFHDQLVSSYVEMGLVDPVVRNPPCYDHVHVLSKGENDRILTRIDLAFLSLMFQDPVNKNCSLYTARCSYLKPSYWAYIRNRVVDVGVFNTWLILKHKIVDYDVDPEEWAPNVVENKSHQVVNPA